MQATLTFLGTGTSMGVPTIGCGCAVCLSALAPDGDPRNRRTRPSIRVDYDGHTVLIDTGPDFHAQALRSGLRRVDAVFYTHGHADHILGMDDLRPLTFATPGSLPLYANDETAALLEHIFAYTFDPTRRYATKARVAMHRLSNTPGAAVELFGAAFQCIPILHGSQRVTGFRFGAAAYLTDMSDIPEESYALLAGLDILVLDALRLTPHPTHSDIANSIRIAERIQPRRTFFTHMSHDIDHATVDAQLPPGIRLAYDGLQLQFEIAPERAPAITPGIAP
jgi:phosphoribosyl 1,2-cyclic phosphate phosphodiesterase